MPLFEKQLKDIWSQPGSPEHREKLVEDACVAEFGKPDPAAEPNDLFRPPVEPVEVKCLHCNGVYRSDEIVLQYRLRMQLHLVALQLREYGEVREMEPLWWCKDPACDGAGFGFDIFPAKENR